MSKNVKRAMIAVGLLVVAALIVIVIIDLAEDGKALGMETLDFVGFWASIATALGFLAIAYQISAQRGEQANQAKDRKAEYTTELTDALHSEEVRKKLRFVYRRKLEDLSLSKLSIQERDMVEGLLGTYDFLGWRLMRGIMDEEAVLEMFHKPIVRCAQLLHLHIKDQRKGREENEELDELAKDKAFFVWLAKECKLYHLKVVGKPRKDKWKKDEVPHLEDLVELLKCHPLSIKPPPNEDANSEETIDTK